MSSCSYDKIVCKEHCSANNFLQNHLYTQTVFLTVKPKNAFVCKVVDFDWLTLRTKCVRRESEWDWEAEPGLKLCLPHYKCIVTHDFWFLFLVNRIIKGITPKTMLLTVFRVLWTFSYMVLNIKKANINL